ncbi:MULTISPECIES: alanine--tRNA ligase [unclassified Frankia]|uniref:alanine--tRNA ligase n=1 Tax=unclassified Frankia TaxID=2632575 RepID=UPI002AD2B4FC|nr:MULTISPECIES: alanine--tRNA ligase [unclassified Frankia]
MRSAEIASRWLRYFAERGHTVVPSASLIADDPTLLLVNAGMVPFKPYFLGEVRPPFTRAASIQKCVRTTDIEEVGRTTRHGSFFQMCGNFSFGDYFKETVVPLAWELLTTPVAAGGYGLDDSRLWVTVYLDDDETAEIWRSTVGVPAERIQRLGMEDNFWSMGVPGPCGPCSEINYDRGPAFGIDGGPAVNGERYLELWNLVFMQSIRGEGSSKKDYPILGDLPSKNIDTGLGLERLAAVLQGVDNLYEIDTSRLILDRAAELTGARYGAAASSDVSLRVVADHVRTSVMLIGDGVLPGNEGRGYVLRRMMRRAIRNMRLLGAPDATMPEMVAVTIEAMGPQYPELVTDRARIDSVATAEEASFLATLRTGTSIFDLAASETKKAGGGVLTGARAFQLHDTFGFPIDLTLEMAAEQGLTVDAEGFRRLMGEQRERAKADARAKKTGHVDTSAYRDVLAAAGPSVFTGYDSAAGDAVVRGLLVAGSPAREAGEGSDVEVVLDRTPFYAEGGGQLADSGAVRLDDGTEIEIFDVQKPLPGLIVHRGRVRSGGVTVGMHARAEIDPARRGAISRSHSATHLTHQALRDALGPSAAQAGSENSPGRFRFDFSCAGAVPVSVLADVEETINQVLIEDLDVHAEVMNADEARRTGAIAMFGEKYGDRVRVVSIGEYSRELCGGTHVRRSGQLGLVKLLGESSVGAGVRRVEALVGLDAYRYLAREAVLVAQITDVLKAPRAEVPERLAGVLGRLRDAEKELEKLRAAQVLAAAGDLASAAEDVGGVALVAHHAPDGTSADDLRRLVLDIRGRVAADRPVVVAAAAAVDRRPVIVVGTSASARDRGIKAGELVRGAAKVLGGGGGGKDDLAQGGGTDPTAIAAALAVVRRTVAQRATA